VAEADDLRQFIRDINLRFERSMRALAAEIRNEVDEMRMEVRLHHERESRRIDDLIEESRAQRRALFSTMDRLDDGGGAAPAA
jgi:hypothetical protein